MPNTNFGAAVRCWYDSGVQSQCFSDESKNSFVRVNNGRLLVSVTSNDPFELSGEVGISLNADWEEPLDNDNSAHREAAERALQISLGTLLHCCGKWKEPNRKRNF